MRPAKSVTSGPKCPLGSILAPPLLQTRPDRGLPSTCLLSDQVRPSSSAGRSFTPQPAPCRELACLVSDQVLLQQVLPRQLLGLGEMVHLLPHQQVGERHARLQQGGSMGTQYVRVARTAIEQHSIPFMSPCPPSAPLTGPNTSSATLHAPSAPHVPQHPPHSVPSVPLSPGPTKSIAALYAPTSAPPLTRTDHVHSRFHR